MNLRQNKPYRNKENYYFWVTFYLKNKEQFSQFPWCRVNLLYIFPKEEDEEDEDEEEGEKRHVVSLSMELHKKN